MPKKIVPALAVGVGICACISVTAYSIYINSAPDYVFECGRDHGSVEDAIYTSCCVCYKVDWMNLVAYAALFILLLFAASVIVERWLTFYYASRQSREFKARIASAIHDHRYRDAINIAALYPKSPLAQVVKAGLEHDQDGLMEGALKLSVEARQRAIVTLTEDLKRGLWNLAAASWTVPLIGLLILLAGFLNTIYGMRWAEGNTPFYVYRSFIESFHATTWSLLISIPVIWFRKSFAAKVETFTLEMDRLSLAIIGQIIGQQKRFFARAAANDYVTAGLDARQTNRLPI